MTDVESQAHSPLTYIVFFESPNRKVSFSYHTFVRDEDPEQLAADLCNAYKQHANRFKRVLYRGVLLKKPTVSIVKLSGVIILNSFEFFPPLTSHSRPQTFYLSLVAYTNF